MIDKEGGQAFPCDLVCMKGMTIRQYYKAAALSGMGDVNWKQLPDTITNACARIADSMLTEDEEFRKREKK